MIDEFQHSEDLREPIGKILGRTKVWRDLWERWRYRLNWIVVEESWHDNTDAIDRDLARGINLRAAKRHLLAADLAIRTFQQDAGILPRSLEDLTPKYLPVPPLDPYSGEPLRYKPSGNSFLLYSIGPDLQDNGGQPPMPGHNNGYDIGL
ncbi:MAG: hypothetical protein ACKVP0_11860 [Pirellulaceae bacterium]